MPLVVDAHQDITYNLINFGRDYLQSPLVTRRLEAQNATQQQAGTATLGLPDAMLGRVGVVFAALSAVPQRFSQSWERLAYKEAVQAYHLALAQMDYYQRLADENERIVLIKSAADLDVVLESWAEGKEFADHRHGLALLMEGADPIIEPKHFEEWYARGVRIVSPAWRQTRYVDVPGAFTDLGRELLEILAGFNAVLDVSYLSDEAFMEALDRYEGTSIIASHSNPRHFCESTRHLSDEMIGALAERDGVMGIMVYNGFLDRSWSPTDRKHKVTLSAVVDVIDYVCQLTGSAAHVGLGSDLDGGFGAESIPDELDTVGDLLQIGTALKQRGFDDGDIEAILGGNMLRKLRQSLS